MLEKERQIKRLQPPIDPIFKMLNITSSYLELLLLRSL